MNMQNQNRDDDDSNQQEQQKMTNSETDGVTSQPQQQKMSQVEVVVQPPTPEPSSSSSSSDNKTSQTLIDADKEQKMMTKPVVQFAGGSIENVAVVVWEATVTGRRLIDEMINLGAYYADDNNSDASSTTSESSKMVDDTSNQQFNEYVMPYGKLPLNVIRNYNLRIVDTGRYRMLKEIRHNRMLKSKSEVAAVNDLATWLIQLQRTKFPNKKIVIVYFEPRHTKILQLFQVNRVYSPLILIFLCLITKNYVNILRVFICSIKAFERFRLLDDIKDILLGCVNAWDLLRQQVFHIGLFFSFPSLSNDDFLI
jgi:maternal-effect protein exuperantia